MKTLIIAEKPSVAADLARVLGKVKKQGDHYENDELVISSAVGHLVELFMPEDMDKKLKRWTLQNMPILPEKFELKPIEKTKKKFQELKKLMGRKDIDCVVNACDAGREGELIFTYIYELAKCKKPMKRMWMMSMTAEGIRQAYEKLREEEEMAPLRDAARCRSESDWLIGINGTRAVTSRMYGSRGRQAATVGRVQTPTLSMVIERERAIRNFEPDPYWKIEVLFGIHAGEYVGIYQKPDFKKNDNEHDRADRLWTEDEAKRIATEVHAQRSDDTANAEIEEEKKRSKQQAPRLYDLTSLQREANSRFGLPAGKTLRIAQSLYEKHKMITYPRTDSRALPEDYQQTCHDVLKNLGGTYSEHANKVLEEGWIKPNKRIFNNKQISDHFAIIPTDQAAKSLSEEEAKIFDMITRRFIAVFYPPAEYDVTTRKSVVAGHTFKTEGKVLAVPGWLGVYGKENQGDGTLPALTEQDGNPAKGLVVKVEMEEDATRPPPRYTEATLLAAMEGAGKLVEDDELAEAMKERGLGTPATRAQTIDHLIHEKYMEREGRELLPTVKAESLIEFLGAMHVEALTSPTMTGEWEHKLRLIQEGEMTRDDFMKGIESITRTIVENAKEYDETKGEMRETKIVSFTDDKPMMETLRTYRSQDEQLIIYKTIGNRRLNEEEVQTLVKDRKVGPLDDFRSKAGKPFSAMLELNEENKVRFVFEARNLQETDEHGNVIDLKQYEAIGKCPLCVRGICGESGDFQVRETPSAYACENVNSENDKCSFRVSRTLLSRSLPREQVEKLIHEGKTDLLDKFKSNRTKRFFSAHLILKEDGKIGFEFAPKAPKKKKKTAVEGE